MFDVIVGLTSVSVAVFKAILSPGGRNGTVVVTVFTAFSFITRHNARHLGPKTTQNPRKHRLTPRHTIQRHAGGSTSPNNELRGLQRPRKSLSNQNIYVNVNIGAMMSHGHYNNAAILHNHVNYPKDSTDLDPRRDWHLFFSRGTVGCPAYFFN